MQFFSDCEHLGWTLIVAPIGFLSHVVPNAFQTVTFQTSDSLYGGQSCCLTFRTAKFMLDNSYLVIQLHAPAACSCHLGRCAGRAARRAAVHRH